MIKISAKKKNLNKETIIFFAVLCIVTAIHAKTGIGGYSGFVVPVPLPIVAFEYDFELGKKSFSSFALGFWGKEFYSHVDYITRNKSLAKTWGLHYGPGISYWRNFQKNMAHHNNAYLTVNNV